MQDSQKGAKVKAMTDQELIQIGELITRSIKELQESIEYLTVATQPIEPNIAIGRLTRMEAIGEKSVNEAMQINTEKRLERLRNALDRLDKGNYGICFVCHKPIPFARLQAVPESLKCVPCAEKKR
ncbi:MAG: TraR/DksA C4-type zinc finger protein [Spirochaetaceae bacterium]|jgi:DnaK suppressor protein|nr:TraR/DksA C4-type zinc finger protein [Spirochaetaceae bacterium]